MLLNCKNGTVNLHTGTLQPHDRKDLITCITAAEMIDPAPACPLWDKFLGEVTCKDTELARYLQKLAGYLLTGSIQEQAFFMLWGSGNNGKSVFLTVIQHLLGTYARSVDFNTFIDFDRGAAPRNDLAALVGKRLVVASESKKGKKFDEPLMKQLTGGDKIAARMLFKEFFEFTPTFKILLATNHKPVIQGTDHGIWRRVRLIPFVAVIPKEQKDEKLIDKLKAESDGILAWAMAGLRMWQSEGLGAVTCMEEAVEEYQDDMDWFKDFLTDVCDLDANYNEQASKLHAAYVAWSKSVSRTPFPIKTFAQMLRDRGFQKSRKNNFNLWHGRRVKPSFAHAPSSTTGLDMGDIQFGL